MSSVNININARDNISPLLSKIQSQITSIQKNANNIRIGGSGGIGGGSGGGGLFANLTAANLAAQGISKAMSFMADQAVDAVQKFMEFEKTSRQFAFAMGKNQTSIASFGGEIERLRIAGFAKEFGFDVRTLTADFAKFAAATKGTNISLAEAEVIFKGTTKAAATYGLANDQVSRIFKAFIDIVSKGKVQSQELVLQLGNNLPGALNLMAKSLGVTTAELREMMKQGKLTSDSIVKLGEYMNTLFTVSAKGNFYSISGQLNNLTNAFDEVKLKFAEGMGPALMGAIQALGFILEKVSGFMEKIFGRPLSRDIAEDINKNFKNTKEGKDIADIEKKYKNDPARRSKAIQEYAEKYSNESTLKLRAFMGRRSTAGPGGPTYAPGIRESLLQEGGVMEPPLSIFGQRTKLSKGERQANERRKLRDQLNSFLSPQTQELVNTYKKDSSEANQSALDVSVIKDLLSVGITSKSVMELMAKNPGMASTVAVARLLATTKPSGEDFGKNVTEANVKELGRTLSVSDILNKIAFDAQSEGGGGAPIDKDKLKTDYHTPKILNINILTGDGASMVSGGINTDINTLEANTTDIRQNIKDILLGQLNDVVNDTATSLARVSKASGAF
jgi:tape measure domain-containing protein